MTDRILLGVPIQGFLRAMLWSWLAKLGGEELNG